MKHFYFMNRPEAVDAEDYENPDGYATFYYCRNERIANGRRAIKSDCQSSGLLSKGLQQKKGRKIMYLFNIIVIIIMFMVWKNMDKQDNQSFFVEDKIWRYYIRLTPKVEDQQELNLYIQNVSLNRNTLRRSYRFVFFHGKGDKISKMKDRKVQVDKVLNSEEPYHLASLKIRWTKGRVIDRVGVLINDKITLTKAIRDESQ
ncbi:MAG: hypothetical protein IEMM0008_0142 [bacterium]|nr:MAG: hypothetical protein IEMM0008_0142 [bacterium]